jgi:hypothetical protein
MRPAAALALIPLSTEAFGAFMQAIHRGKRLDPCPLDPNDWVLLLVRYGDVYIDRIFIKAQAGRDQRFNFRQ